MPDNKSPYHLRLHRFGYVPNAARVYMQRRSQPPLLASMFSLYLANTGDFAYVNRSLPLLEREYRFWIEQRSLNVSEHSVARYDVDVELPRPEEYAKDWHVALHAPDKRSVYRNILSACESGLDFSTRWGAADAHADTLLAHLETTHVVPVDLNAWLCLTEQSLARFFRRAGT